jgi:hypothetical protein
VAQDYYAWVDPSAANYAAVVLFTIVWTMIVLVVYALLRKGIMQSARGVLGPLGAPASARSNVRST